MSRWSRRRGPAATGPIGPPSKPSAKRNVSSCSSAGARSTSTIASGTRWHSRSACSPLWIYAPSPTRGFYWPIRGELDLRGIARGHIEAGGATGLPVVVAKNEPVEFWSWEPTTAMQRGFWNIPVPHARRCVTPDVLVIPLVGYDAAGYRLGYGGGFYDRTLAALTPRPFCIGVGFDDSQLEQLLTGSRTTSQ